MKRWLLAFALASLFASTTKANGVCIVKAADGTFFPLVSSDVTVSVNNQIATVTAVQVFKNTSGGDTLKLNTDVTHSHFGDAPKISFEAVS